jgi:anti-sigma factor RsiW
VTEPHEHPIDDLAAYVLGSLEDPERTRVETHVTTCTTCASRLAEYRAVVGTLPIGLDPLASPPEAWKALRAAAREGRRSARGSSKRLFRARWRWVMWPALTAVAASLVVWNVVLHRELAQYSSGPQVEALARRPGRLVILVGSGSPGASARLLVTAVGDHGHLAIAGLKPLPPQRAYQVWFVRKSGPTVTGGTFSVDGNGRAWAWVTVPVSLDEVRAITVTEEPSPGSAVPTGNDLLKAESWR